MEPSEEDPRGLSGLHREVYVLLLEDIGVCRPTSRVAYVRQMDANGVGRGRGAFAETVGSPCEALGGALRRCESSR